MSKNRVKIIIAWVMLIVLIILFLYTNYVKYFYIDESKIEENAVEDSSSEAINSALVSIVDNFNNDPLVEEYYNNGIKIKAILNNYSLYISYYDGTTITYEFIYDKLKLNINITNSEDNLKKFNSIYEILLKAIQKRIGNEGDVDVIIKSHINENKEIDGVVKTIAEDNNIINYSIDITKKFKEIGE